MKAISSLQRAAQDESNKSNDSRMMSHPLQGGSGTGTFENCFATGLDLSEFITTRRDAAPAAGASTAAHDDSHTIPTDDGVGGVVVHPSSLLSSQPPCAAEQVESASALLLKTKQIERDLRLQQEAEEARMEQALQRRIDALHMIELSASTKTAGSMNHPSSLCASPSPRGGSAPTMHVVDALIKMHGNDRNDTTTRRSHKTKGKINRRQQVRSVDGGVRKLSSGGGGRRKPRVVAKAKKRSKH
jgi:hypothetical protein